MSKVEPYVPPGDYELPPIVGVQNGLILFASIAFALLFAERGLYEYLSAPRIATADAAIAIALSGLLVFVGMLASFLLPARAMPESDQTRWIPHTLEFLLGQGGIAVACVVISFAAALVVHVYIAQLDLMRTAWLLRDDFMYIVLAAFIYHGFVLFVRYLGFLYQTGGADKLKVIAFEVAAMALLLIMGLYVYTMDTVQILRAGPNEGLLALHLVVRDILLAIMVGYIITWQIGRAGDH